MNEDNKKVLQKLGLLYKKLGFKSTPVSYTAIAFDWYPTELGKPYNITLVLKIIKTTENGILEVASPDIHYIEFDELSILQKLRGSSETVGLIPKTSFYYDEDKAAVFERNLADIVIHTLYEIFNSGENCVILQGPLFPKLAGRLGYRHFDRNKIIASLTFRTEWLPQIPVKSLFWNTEIMSDLGNKFFKPPDENNAYGCADIKSPDGLTETLKTWGIIPSGKNKEMLYALDMYCQFPYDPKTQESLWVEKLKILKKTFSFPGLIFEKGEALWLPFGLACAVDRSIYYGHRPLGTIELIFRDSPHREYLYYYERDVKRMYDNRFSPIEVVGRRVCLYEAMSEEELFQSIVTEALKIYTGDRNVIKEEATKAISIDRRGNLLTKVIMNIFGSSETDVMLWKKII